MQLRVCFSFKSFRVHSEGKKCTLLSNINVWLSSWLCCDGGISAEVLLAPLKPESKRNFEEVVSSHLSWPGLPGSQPSSGGHKALGEQGMAGAHMWPSPPQAHEHRTSPFCAVEFQLAK